MVDVSDPAITDAYNEIRSNSPTNWVILGYNGNTKLKVEGTGTGGVNEACDHLDDGACQFGFLKVTLTADDNTTRTKFVLFSWGGPNASPLKRGKMSVHKASVKTIYKEFALEFAVDDKDEFTEEQIIERIKKVNY